MWKFLEALLCGEGNFLRWLDEEPHERNDKLQQRIQASELLSGGDGVKCVK